MNAERPIRLGEILLDSKIIDHLQLNTALKYQREWDRKLGEALVELGFISESVLVKVLSKFLHVPSVELGQVRINPAAIQKVPRRLAEKYGLIPLDVEGKVPKATLVLAMLDPTNLIAIDDVSFSSGCKVKPVVASHSEIDHAIRRYYGDDRIVDVFFETPKNLVMSPENGGQSLPFFQDPSVEAEEMVLIRDERQATLEPEKCQNSNGKTIEVKGTLGGLAPTPPAVKDYPEPIEGKGGLPGASLPNDLAEITPDLLVKALVRILVRKGLFALDEIHREIEELEKMET